ncbi:hypothetical protein [Siphonobacter aquaeclarae]|jgi:presenilin-like A22 family membrane protease|uniref:Uncharacterized protein n=1 Tax=Siphonobacter aquaeclarae TaxID=563176 RepID=A0A1G9Q987_9BACT|nr:hypothetical protein [Siphonobacter aquaeclarae]MBO9636781.1 hypothetical protein [Siphonobacter aquaeclarae]SDM07576.1 hypothetical protein SAMN04488090_2522 [Siphonobacter aquaeclarae]
MPRPANQQLNDLVGLIIPFGYAAMGYYLVSSAEVFEEQGILSATVAYVLGGLFFAYALLKAYWAFSKWRRNQEEE